MELYIQFCKILLLLGLCNICSSAFYDYYWREYTPGEIPDDAVEGGWDQNNKRTYIGHVYLNDRGVMPANIYQDKSYVITNRNGLYNVTTNIWILSSPTRSNFHWIPVTEDNFKDQIAYSYLVKGGMEKNQTLNIGRISYEGEVIVGKAFAYWEAGITDIYFAYKDREINASSYEILVVDEE